MKIQEVCEKTGYTKRNIHFYIKEGLLTPAMSPGGHYMFTEEDCQKLLLTRILRNADVPVPVIRAIFSNPGSAGYYLNKQIKERKQEQLRLNGILHGLNYILDHLSIEPDMTELFHLSTSAEIPSSPFGSVPDSYDQYDNTQINRYLWSVFLPEKLTDYQEFLWNKINRMTSLPENEDCRMLNQFFHTLDESTLTRLFRKQESHLSFIANLDPDGCTAYAEELKHRLSAFLEQPSNIRVWKEYYHAFLYPQIRIYDLEVSNIAAEMSPMFASYRINIHMACRILYEWLYSEQGETLRSNLEAALTPYLDLELSQHGQLEVLANFRQLVMGERFE